MATSSVSGIDTELIIQSYMTQWRQKYITPLESDKESKTTEKSALSTLSNYMSSFKTKNLSLLSGTTFMAKTAVSSDEATLTAAADMTAVNGIYNVTVNQLAQLQKVASNQFTSANTDIVTAEGAGVKTFRITIDGTDTDINVTLNAGDTNAQVLTSIATAINSSGAEANAIVVNETATTSRLVISSRETGLTNAMTIQDLAGSVMLNAGVIDGGGAIQNELQAAQDALFSVDTLNFQRSSNTVSDVITGTTLQLLKGAGATSTVTVSTDTAAIEEKLSDYIEGYNTLIQYARVKTAYDPDTKEKGDLMYYSVARRLESQFRPLLTGVVSGLSDGYNLLANIGIEIDKDGLMSITDSGKLTSMLQNHLSEVEDLFNSAGAGIAVRVDDYLDVATDTDGAIAAVKNSIQDQIDQLDYLVDLKERALEAYEQTLRARYAALESLLTTNQSILSSFNNIGLFQSY